MESSVSETQTGTLWLILRALRLPTAVHCACVGMALVAPALRAQQGAANVGGTSVPAKAWAQDAAAKEIELILHPGSYIRFRQRSIDAKRDELREVIESKDGTVARLIMRDNRPLTAEEDQAERDRLNGLVEHPSEFAKHMKNDVNGKKQAIDLIKIMPEAMIYTYAPDQTPTPESSNPQVVIDYAPNPKFNPPTTISEALSGLRGRVWIDAKSKTIVRMNAEVFQGVNVGWGMLAHIYAGGTADVEQADTPAGRWNMTHFHEHITVKALMVKTISVNAEVHSMEFQKLPGPLTYQEAIQMLLNTPLPK